MIEKVFYSKDFIFNNGIVNLYNFLEEKNFDLEKELSNNYLSIKIDEKRSDDIYFEILKKFFKEKKIVYQTDNDRWYFDEKNQDFKKDKRFDILGAGPTDVRNCTIYIEPKVDNELLLTRLKKFGENENIDIYQKNSKLSYEPIFSKDGALKKKKLNKHITLDEFIISYIEYLKGKEESFVKLDSKIHTFEDGQKSFQSMLKIPKNYKIDKWEALIYWFGGRIQRFYNFNYFIYPNSTDLLSLRIFKKELKIKDDKASIKDKNGKLKTINTNIDFYNQLTKDGIFNPNFYISKSEQEFELKFFMYLFSLIYHIEEQYEKANPRRKKLKEILYESLEYITFIIYNDDGTFKTSFSEYTKAYKLIKFFEKLREAQDKESNLFVYLADILTTISLSQKNSETNLNLKKYCEAILNFKNLRKLYYQISFNILKNDSKSFGKRLFDFENFYLHHILKGEMMDIHKLSKTIGDGIGYFCAELGDKDLLFKLRSIKNYKQLLSYFKDLKFAILKNDNKAKFSKEFNEALEEILKTLESKWEIVRDYIAIYAIDKYRASTYAKNQGGK